MVKPPPTRTRAKAPVSLPSVKALSTPPAEVKAAPAQPAIKPPPAPAAAATTSQPARPAPVVIKAAVPAPSGNSGKAGAPAVTAAAQPPAKAAAKPPRKAVSTKLKVEKPVAKVAAARKPAPSAPAEKAAEARPEPVLVKLPPKPAAEVVPPPRPEPAAVPPATAVAGPAQAAPAAAKEPAKPSALDSLSLPRPPAFAAITSETVMSQALTMARAFGALQARMLEHACAEFKATLGDAETLARTESASEAIALQAKAVRRSYESYAEHLKELARIANTALRKD